MAMVAAESKDGVPAPEASGDARPVKCPRLATVAVAAPPGSAVERYAATGGVIVRGPFRLEHLVVSIADGLRQYSEAVEEATEAHWKQVLIEKPRSFDGPVWCLRSYRVVAEGEEEERPGAFATETTGTTGVAAAACDRCGGDDGAPGAASRLHLELQRSSFKYVMYTHMSREARERLPAEERAGACGLMALTKTHDGFLIFGKRSSRLATMPGYWHCVPAGQVDSPRAEEVLAKELKEELGCDAASMQGTCLLGLMDTGTEQGHKTEFVFATRLRETAADLHELYKQAEDRAEHEALIFVKLDDVCANEWESLSFPVVDVQEFLSGQYHLTDISRRGLQFYRELLQGGLVV